MASCKPFDVSFKGRPDRLFTTVKSLLEQQKGTIRGTPQEGRFTVEIPVLGKIQGNYKIVNKKFRVHVTERPFLLGCGAIESFVQSNVPN